MTRPTPPMLRPGDVATRFGVTPSTVQRWMEKGAVTVVRTPGGHRRIVDDDKARPTARRA